MTAQKVSSKQFSVMRKQLEKYDQTRDELIKQSRDLLRDAKHAIYLGHEGKLSEAQKHIQALAKAHKSLRKNVAKTLDATDIGAYLEALEEYIEAACFIAFLLEKPLPQRQTLAVPIEQYLSGLSDTTGELGRHAIHLATARDVQGVERVWKFINSIHGELLQFHLRNGTVRKKFDAIKYNLKTVEQARYELSLRTGKQAF